MEHLTKQQIVLLTLLVSFMTSLSTGIVTVSLMDQAPTGVTRTINQIIEKTVQSAPQTASVGAVSISVDDQVANITALVASSTVKIKNNVTNALVGLGIIVNKSGEILTDRTIIEPNTTYSIILADGTSLPVYPDQTISNLENSVILLTTNNNFNNTQAAFMPANSSSGYRLGQKVFAITGTSSYLFNDGLIDKLGSSTISTTFIENQNGSITQGSPLFDINGNVLAIYTNSSFFKISDIFISLKNR